MFDKNKSLFILGLLLFAFSNLFAQHEMKKDEKEKSPLIRSADVEVKSLDVNTDGKLFQCPMCVDVISDAEAECPKCGMKLKELTVDAATVKFAKGKAKSMDGMKHMKEMKTTAEKEMAMHKEKKTWNAFCPVRGGEVDPEAPTVEYDGKLIGFCCPGCDGKFSADPEKFMKNLSEDGQIFIGEK
ncbi:MAG: hypothetical protein K9J16_16105 [Melioribacteraceae bacterium]|nr:hypothetical protein [Melioribacteraceae bacterium]MCF8353192.1 hypothetical protein [Melioribacteraceae bacterium]MCF8395341.1 hypothetical protein [Melioribacteraceae bacterium]MCF8418774.1 hypothetical protein [Melioribacteraceae bacterium]